MLVTITEYAKLKKTSRMQLYRRIKRGDLKAYLYKGRQLVEVDKQT